MPWQPMSTAPDDGAHIQVRTTTPHRDPDETPWLVRWGGWRSPDDLYWINVAEPSVANNPDFIEWNPDWVSGLMRQSFQKTPNNVSS